MLLSLTCFVILNLLTIYPAESALSMAKTRRTQSMSEYTRHTESNPIPSTSQQQSKSSLVNVKSKPAVSSSNQSLKEIELRPLIDEETLHVRAASALSLRSASLGTHSGGHINPARDGVKARIRNILQRYVAPVAIGSAIGGVGTYVGINSIKSENKNCSNIASTPTPTPITNTTETTDSAQDDDDDDDIINRVKKSSM